MLGRRRIETSTPIRSSLADAAFAVEERVVWGGADVLRRLGGAVKWPFERLIWAVERGLVWPLEERTDSWSASARIGGATALALLAVAAGVLGLVLASNGGGETAPPREVAAQVVQPPATPSPAQAQAAPTAPALQGATPDFTPEADGGVAKGSAEIPSPSASASVNSSAEIARSAPSAPGAAASTANGKVAGPAAIEVARQFAGAFVLYETGRKNADVRGVFAETATAQLSRALLQRPPRLPAGAEVPKAKVLNVVPGPRRGDTYTLSVSLLRVGVTSELRLDMQHDKKTGEWLVTDVRG